MVVNISCYCLAGSNKTLMIKGESTYLFGVCISMIMMHAFLVHSDEAILNSLVRERGFSIRDVPRDGVCLFSAVSVQLNSFGIQPGETNLREQLVEYLEAHPYTHDGSSHFRNYISAPVVSDDLSNADTEAPSEQDDIINSVDDLQLRQQLRWLHYLERLNAGAWGIT